MFWVKGISCNFYFNFTENVFLYFTSLNIVKIQQIFDNKTLLSCHERAKVLLRYNCWEFPK